MTPSVMPVMVSYKSRLWIRVALRSFRRFFPDSPLLILDNNPDPGMAGYGPLIEEERAWIKDWCSQDYRHYFEPTKLFEKNHGLAMDWAARWCRSYRIRWMLHIEPDCLIDGVEWANRLLAAIQQDIWMVGSHRKFYGPIHPTPSLWAVNRIQASFREQLRGSDASHPRFSELMDMKGLMASLQPREVAYWTSWWDTAQKPWFDAAIHDRTLLIEESPDFRHFWGGSSFNVDPAKSGDPRVAQYL